MKLNTKHLIACLCLSSLSATAFADNTLPSAQTYSTGIPYRGVSLSGGEFADSGNGWAPAGKFIPNLNDSALFIYKGMNTYRIPISWEYLADINGNITAQQSYLTALDNIITELTAKNATIIIDIHNYMRFNPANVSKDYENTDPNGSDVIGVGKDAPSTAAFAKLWANIANRYHSPNIIYALMNEPHDMSSDIIAKNENAAIEAIRQQEKTLNISPHLILIDGNNWTGLHSWDQSIQGNPANSDVFPAKIIDPANHIAIEVHQYFDSDSSGQYKSNDNNGDCLSLTAFQKGYTYKGQEMPGFDTYWPKFTTWAKNNNVKIFLGEFGSPDTANCKADINYTLGELNKFADVDAKQDSGVIGWTVWSAGHAWGNYTLSIAPGGPANNLMWDKDSPYTNPNFLTPNGTIPELNPVAAQITNNSSKTLNFGNGYWPFQIHGSATLAPGATAALYSNNETSKPTGQLELSYFIGQDSSHPLGFGITDNGYTFSYPNSGAPKYDPTPIDGVIFQPNKGSTSFTVVDAQ